MIHVIVRERDAEAQATEPITSGSVGLAVSFRFSGDWTGMGKAAIFKGSGTAVDVALTEDSCEVPHEVLASAGGHLKIGVYGTGNEGRRVTPTIWADAGEIREGAEPSEVDPTPATESLVQQILEAAEDAADLAQSVRDDADNGVFDGADGEDGVSPAVSVSTITGGHRLTITDKDHPNGQTVDVMDGDAAEAYVVTLTANNGTYSSDKLPSEIKAAKDAGKRVYLLVGGTNQVGTLAASSNSRATFVCVLGGTIFTYYIYPAHFVNVIESKCANVFWAIYGQTTSLTAEGETYSTDIEEAYQAGKIVLTVATFSGSGTDIVLRLVERISSTHHCFAAVDGSNNFYTECDDGVWSALTNGGGSADIEYFEFVVDDINDMAVTPGTGVTTSAIFTAHAAGKTCFAKITFEDANGEQILPLTFAYDGTTDWIEFAGGFWDGSGGHPVALRYLGTTGWVYELMDYVNRNQGSTHAGKFLVVGNDGIVTPMTMATWQGGNY